ncbi:MAG TPA: T9SS type A sorting domain-containing protein [Ignavibacteria bacterium]|nr:T9SS type A sorting domain-containing protein [Ignavibacteria bacterium]
MKFSVSVLLTFILFNLCADAQPWKNPLKICRSANGADFNNFQTFQDSSGVPNVIKLPSGVLISAFQWFRQPVGSATWDRVAVKFSSDNGINWTQPQPITVNGLPVNFTRPFDPTLAVTDNARIRIYFSDGMSMISDTSVNTYSAVSDDGINFTMEPGIRFTLPDRPVVDPAVIKFRNLWHLINPVSNMTSGGAFHNISGDGFNFTRVADIPSDNSHSWIGNYMIKDTNELRFYGSGMGIWYASSPNGGEWSGYISTNVIGGDPSVLKLSDTNYLMIYTGPPYTTSVTSGSENISDFHLYQNFPNPFNPVTNLEFEIPKLEFVSLKVYDILGNEIASLVNNMKEPGNYRIEFDGRNYSSSIYYYKLTAGSFSETKRMVLLK